MVIGINCKLVYTCQMLKVRTYPVCLCAMCTDHGAGRYCAKGRVVCWLAYGLDRRVGWSK
jgi:hypothetical protein